MKVLNSRGRVLLEVTGAYVGPHGVTTYMYRGDGCGGCVTRDQLEQTIHFIKLDQPSAKVSGQLPEPKEGK